MDPNRLTVDELLLHHAVTPMWKNYSKAWIAQWFSDNGFARAYGSNPANWSGLINPYTGGRSYSQAHLAGQYVDGDCPDASPAEIAAGFRLVELVQDIWNVITWHAGNWYHNRKSIAIENLGDFRGYTLEDNAQRVIADFWRPQDQALGGATAVFGHREVSDLATECPARIMEVRDNIVNYINNPPQPPQPNKPTWRAMTEPRKLKAKENLFVIDLLTGANVGDMIPAGREIEFATETEWNGQGYYRSRSSTDNARDWGIRRDQVEEIHVPVVEVKTEVVESKIPFTSEIVEDPTTDQDEIIQKGAQGVRTIVYRVTYTDGAETNREVVSDVTIQPVNQITKIGTKPENPPVDPDKPTTIIGWIIWVIKQLLSKFNKEKMK